MPSRTVATISGCEWPSTAAHLARGEVQHARAVGVVEKCTLGPNPHEVDELAAVFQKVTPSALPKLDVVGAAGHFHHSPPHRSQTETGSGRGLARNRYWRRQKRPVSRDKLAVEKDELPRRMSGDGFGYAARGNREQMGRRADRDAVIGDAKRLCAGGADQVEGDLHLAVAPEVPFPADDRRAFQ